MNASKNSTKNKFEEPTVETINHVSLEESSTYTDPDTGKTISQKTALIAGSGTLLTGAAIGYLFTGQEEVEEILLDSNNDTLADKIISDSNNDGIYEVQSIIEETADITETELEPEAEATTQVETSMETEQTPTLFNPNTAPMTNQGTVSDSMDFAEAFSSARHELGAGGVFAWHGQYYNTFYAEEINDAYEPSVQYATVEHHPLPKLDYSTEAEQMVAETEANQEEQIVSANSEQNTQNEIEVQAIDSNKDIPEGAVLIDTKIGNEEIVVLDENGNIEETYQPTETELESSEIYEDIPEGMLEADFDDIDNSNQLL